jgi:hypothetical protein
MRKISTIALVVAAAGVLARPASAVGAPTIDSPVGGTTNPNVVHFAGTSSSNAAIDVVEAGSGGVVATTLADETGHWSFDEPMPDGGHTIYAVEEQAGSAPSSSVSFTVDAVRPTPRIARPSDGAVFPPGTPATLGGTATDDRGVLAVQVEYWLAHKMVQKKNTTCDGCGTNSATWTDQPKFELPGYYVAKVAAYDLAGNRSEQKQVTFFTSGVDTLPAEQPKAPDPSTLPKPPPIQTPDPGSFIPGGGSGPGGTPVIIGGTTTPGNTVKVYEQEEGWIGTTVGDERTGRWAITYRFEDGTYGVRARAINSRGKTSPFGARVVFTVDGIRPQVDVQTESDPVVFVPTQEVVLRGTTGDERQVIAVNLEYWYGDKMVLVQNASCPLCATQRKAEWTDRPNLAMPGYYWVYVRAIDEAGNRSLTDTIRFVKTV